LEEVAREKGLATGAMEIWFADEVHVGQKNKITRRWARRGTRPTAPQDQRTASTYIFGAICPKAGKAAGLVLPHCNTAATSLHLAEISAAVAPGAHAVLLLDQAGWYLSDRLELPSNITLIPLPPKCPEFRPRSLIGASRSSTEVEADHCRGHGSLRGRCDPPHDGGQGWGAAMFATA
jgi:hypothetical protein